MDAISSPIELQRRYSIPVYLVWTLLSAAVVSFIVGVLFDKFWWPPDDGAYAHIASRVANGETLNGTVQDLHLGYVNLLHAWVFATFGESFLNLRIPLVLLQNVQALIVFLLFAHRGLLLAFAASIAITSLSFIQFLNPTAHWYCLFLAVAAAALISFEYPKLAARYLGLGIVIGLTFGFRQLSGVFLGMGVLAFLFFEISSTNKKTTNLRQLWLARFIAGAMACAIGAYCMAKVSVTGILLIGAWPLLVLVRLAMTLNVKNSQALVILGLLVTGALFSLLPLIGYHLLYDNLDSWLNDTVVAAFSLTEMSFITDADFGNIALVAIHSIFSFRNAIEVANGFFWLSLLSLPVISGLIVFNSLETKTKQVPPLAMIAIFYALISLHYQIPIYLFYTSGFSCLALLSLLQTRTRTGQRAVPALLLSLSAFAIYYHAAQPVERGFTGTIKGDRIVQSRVVPDTVSGISVTDSQARSYKILIEEVQQHSELGDPILAVPFSPEVYFLTNRQNPLRVYNTGFGISNNDDMMHTLEVLSQNPPRVVVYKPDDKYNNTYSAQIMDWVTARYTGPKRIGDFDVYYLTG